VCPCVKAMSVCFLRWAGAGADLLVLRFLLLLY
jgi:hypothetical protein